MSEENSLSQDISAAMDGGGGVTESTGTDTPQTGSDPSQTGGATASPEQQALAELAAPSNWADPDKQMFSGLAKADRKAAEWLLNRHKSMESHLGKRMQQVAPIQRQWQQFQEMLAPHRRDFNMNGMDDMGAVRMLLSAHQALRENPAQGLQQLAQRYGVDLRSLAQEQPQVDPQFQTLQQQIAQLTAHIRNRDVSASEQQVQSLSSQVGEWSQAKDEAGQLKFPHFDSVADDMVDRINALRGRGAHVSIQQLQDIYDQAVWANPNTRAQQMLAQQTADRKKADAERQKKADEARRAGFDVKGQGGVNTAPNPGDSVRASLEQAFSGN